MHQGYSTCRKNTSHEKYSCLIPGGATGAQLHGQQIGAFRARRRRVIHLQKLKSPPSLVSACTLVQATDGRRRDEPHAPDNSTAVVQKDHARGKR